MSEIKKYIEMLEDLELDDPQGTYPLFADCFYYDKSFNQVTDSSGNELYLSFESEDFTNVFKRKLDFIDLKEKTVFKTAEVKKMIEQNQKNNFNIKNLPCFLI
ncbi:hypothetical protein [Croceitalea rosinachiae]|uniref:Uncharacterized protein n=1 Tax=Croceitalea rosinachiae TaxID=3075596 RepID=A0ABU3ADZ2_9FLAO|nr:hypothetical protein [Croceitalea sp. F388]MDT0608015.1 hypothetical protein [Croceitalea sp. F388]